MCAMCPTLPENFPDHTQIGQQHVWFLVDRFDIEGFSRHTGLIYPVQLYEFRSLTFLCSSKIMVRGGLRAYDSPSHSTSAC